jgi:anthranilate/para-aminobenzoate synthase component I
LKNIFYLLNIMVEIASFDIFETVLARRTGSPYSGFMLLGKKAKKFSLIHCSPEAFAQIRQEAERRAFLNNGGLDSKVSLETIIFKR